MNALRLISDDDDLEPEISEIHKCEQIILSCILAKPESLSKIVGLRPSHFQDRLHKQIYRAARELLKQDQVIDPLRIQAQMKRSGDQENHCVYVMDLLLDFYTDSSLDWYVAQVIEAANKRSLLRLDIEGIVKSADTVDGAISALEVGISNIRGNRLHDLSLGLEDLMLEFDDRMEERAINLDGITGLATGIRQLDTMTSGLQMKELTTLAARPSMGKSALMLKLAWNIAHLLRKRVVIFSAEMPRPVLLDRIISQHCRIPLSIIKTGRLTPYQWGQKNAAYHGLTTAPLTVLDHVHKISEVESIVKRMAAAGHKPCAVFLDHLMLFSLDDQETPKDRREEVGEIVRRLTRLAKKMDLHVVLLHQLNRNNTTRMNKRPTMADLRESGEIEQDSDNVILLHRDDYYDRDTRPGTADLLIEKQRNGPTGEASLQWDKEYGDFTENV